jgi:hypothetical protein
VGKIQWSEIWKSKNHKYIDGGTKKVNKKGEGRKK